jgi:hypothetical protein
MSRLQLISEILKFHSSFRSLDMSAGCALLGPQIFFRKAGSPVFTIIYILLNQPCDRDVLTGFNPHEDSHHE